MAVRVTRKAESDPFPPTGERGRMVGISIQNLLELSPGVPLIEEAGWTKFQILAVRQLRARFPARSRSRGDALQRPSSVTDARMALARLDLYHPNARATDGV